MAALHGYFVKFEFDLEMAERLGGAQQLRSCQASKGAANCAQRRQLKWCREVSHVCALKVYIY